MMEQYSHAEILDFETARKKIAAAVKAEKTDKTTEGTRND
jgi:hypothetical protein